MYINTELIIESIKLKYQIILLLFIFIRAYVYASTDANYDSSCDLDLVVAHRVEETASEPAEFPNRTVVAGNGEIWARKACSEEICGARAQPVSYVDDAAYVCNSRTYRR